MARTQMTAAALLVVGMMGWMAGCESAVSGGADHGVRSSYGNITTHEDEWAGVRTRETRPAPAPARAEAPRQPAPAPAPAPAREPASAPQPQMAGDAMYLPTGDRNTSALSLRCMMPQQVIAGQNFTYNIEVCNLTGMALSNVQVTYTLDGARVVSSEPAMSGNAFNVGELKARECRTIKVTASAPGTGTVRGCMGATWQNALCCGTSVVQPALRIVKDVTPKEGTPCDSFTYTITVSNTGTGAATNVKVMDDLPSGVTSDNRQNLSWDIGTLGAGQSQTRTFTAKAGKTGSYANTARAAADNGLTADSGPVGITVRQPVLAISKDCPQTVFIGRPAQYKITVRNTGDAPATNVVVRDQLPGGLTFTSASDGGQFAAGAVSWNLGTLAPGATKDLTLVAGGGTVGSAAQNTVTATATCAQQVSANCSTTFQGVPDMRTALDDAEGVVAIGNNHEYIYSVGNQGQIPLTNVQVKITLPAGLNFVSADNTVQAPAVAGQVQTYSLGTLAPGQNKTFRFTVKGTRAGEVLVISETSAAEMKTTVRDDEVTNFVDR